MTAARLHSILSVAAERGFLGPRPVDDQIAHSWGFAVAVGAAPEGGCADLGSGGGVPALVLAVEAWPESRWTLVDGMVKRCQFLVWAVDQLGVTDRVAVRLARAEHVGRVGEPLRASCALVTARAFGPPHHTAEVAAPLLRVGGLLVVSEPPASDGSRWDPAGCRALGLDPQGVVTTDIAGYMVLRQARQADDEYPRAWKRQQRHPLFST